MVPLFLKGFVIGFAIAAPVGPIGLLCIQRSLNEGFRIGLFTGLGAAIADGTYGLIAGLGLTAIAAFMEEQLFWIRLLGGLFLIYLGIRIFITAPRGELTAMPERSSLHAFTTTYLLTLTNPLTLLSFMVIFAGLGLATSSTDYVHSLILVSGITLGSASWWFLLSGGLAWFLHHRLSTKWMGMINKFSGLIIFTFGVVALIF